MKRILYILLCFLPFIVFAEDIKYDLVIENNNISVKKANTDEIVNDYSNILTYQDGVLTLKEGTIISKINYNDIDLTITSNNKVAHIGYINHENFTINENIHHTLTIQNFKNNDNTPVHLEINARYTKMIIKDSTIYEIGALYNDYAPINSETEIVISNANLYFYSYPSQIHLGGPIYITNSKIVNARLIHSEESYINIDNSEIDGQETKTKIYTESGNGYIIVNKSTIKNGEQFEVGSQNVTSENNLYIKDSDIEIAYLNIYPSKNKNSIENSTLKLSEDLDILSPLFLTNTTIEARGGIFTSINMNNSKLNLANNLTSYYYNELTFNKIVLQDSSINSSRIYSEMEIELYNSMITNIGEAVSLMKSFKVENSKLYFITESTIFFRDTVTITNSNVYMESQNPVLEIVNDKNIIINGDYIITDKDNKLIHTKKTGTNTRYVYEDESETKSLMFSPKINITFKIENGTWNDGTTNNIVLEKNYWSNLSEDEIPKNMKPKKGYEKGSWNKDIVYDDLKEEYEYVYTFVKKPTEKNIIIDGKNKAIKEQDKIINPNTEDKIYLCLVILIITILVIINYKHKKIKKYY